MTRLEEAVTLMTQLNAQERANLLSVTMRLMIETGEVEASSIRSQLKLIEEGG